MAASDVGVKSSGTVTGWKNGAIPRQGVLKRLADYFGVSVSDLTGEQKEKPAPEGELDEVTQKLFRLINESADSERQQMLDYIEFIKNKRQKGELRND